MSGPTQAPRSLAVSTYHRTCATRGRGRKFYSVVLAALSEAPSWGDLVLSFEGVEFVSPSFLDEVLVRLAMEHPGLASRVRVRGVHSTAAKQLEEVLRTRGLDWTFVATSAGDYSLRT